MIKKFKIQLSLKNRVYLVNAILLCITLVGAALMVWYTYKIERIFKEIFRTNVAISRSADALSNSMINQKGFMSYYLLDKNPDWIDQLMQYRVLFNDNLLMVKSLVKEPWEIKAIAEIEKEYKVYIEKKDKVFAFYKADDIKNGSALHKQVRSSFFSIIKLCNRFTVFHKNMIQEAIEVSQKEANRLRYIALTAVVTVTLLSLLVNFIFARHILAPIRKLALQADTIGYFGKSANEITALKQSVLGLIENAEQTHLELQHSRESLMQSEKMALVGKLAAGTSHSIRNPLTSVKMRLFSLNRSCSFTESQQEDYNIISGEIMQINKIVENFLEFARPPKLIIKKMSPSSVVDSAIHLLDQRLKSYNVTTKIIRNGSLTKTLLDPEQLKEVIVNIIINACEALGTGESITIHEEESYAEPLKKVDVIRIIDDGEGMSKSIKDHVFEPFFTTKEGGTGLGLSIAFNIINEHGGWLDVSSEKGKGTSFVITLPIKD